MGTGTAPAVRGPWPHATRSCFCPLESSGAPSVPVLRRGRTCPGAPGPTPAIYKVLEGDSSTRRAWLSPQSDFLVGRSRLKRWQVKCVNLGGHVADSHSCGFPAVTGDEPSFPPDSPPVRGRQHHGPHRTAVTVPSTKPPAQAWCLTQEDAATSESSAPHRLEIECLLNE